MRRISRTLLLAAPLPLLATLGYLIQAGSSTLGIPSPPRLVFDTPATLDLGERERNQQSVARFTIGNDGGRELVIDGIGVSCVCRGLEQERDGSWWRIDRLTLVPGARAEVAMRLTVRGEVGSQQRSRAWFQTNDPEQPQAGLEALVSKIAGGFEVYPKNLLLGRLYVGSTQQRTLEIRDRALEPRKPARVETNLPEHFAVRLVPLDEGTRAPNEGLGNLVGRIELTIHTTSPGSIDGELLVFHDDPARRPDRIRVNGEVTLPIEVSPRELLLPRGSGSGLVHHGEIRVRCLLEDSFEVSLDDVPADLAVGIEADPKMASDRIIRVELLRTPSRRDGFRKLPLQLRARIGATSYPITVTVLCQ